MNQGTCIRCALGPSLGVVVRSPWPALGGPSLSPALLKKRSLELDQQPQLYKCLGIYVWQRSHFVHVAAFPSARVYTQPRGRELSEGVTVHRHHWNSCHHLSACSSFTVHPGDRNHPFPSSLGRSPSAPLKTLSTGMPKKPSSSLRS